MRTLRVRSPANHYPVDKPEDASRSTPYRAIGVDYDQAHTIVTTRARATKSEGQI